MARVVGIDIQGSWVRAVLLQVSARRVQIEQVQELSVDAAGSVAAALRAIVLPMLLHGEAVAACMNGTQVFVHRLSLPKTALRQLAEVLPYEIEALVPVDIDELTYDYHVLQRKHEDGVAVLAVCARTEHVRQFIGDMALGIGREPERVGCGAASLANLVGVCQALKVDGPYALIDLGLHQTEIVVVAHGEVVFLRTLSRGVSGLPGTAPQLGAELRQTLLACVSQGGGAIGQVYLTGSGAALPQAAEFLAGTLGIAVAPLPALDLANLTPEVSEAVPRFAKAIGAALALTGRPRDFDLRRGSLAFQRGYGFLKEKVPLLVGFGVAIVISFLFSMGSNLYTLSLERERLTTSLAKISTQVLGSEAEDAEQALSLLTKAKAQEELEPLPMLDAYDVLIEISKAVPASITHDIESFDLQRGHVRLNGVLGTADEAQRILANLKEHRCIQAANVSKITAAVNSDRKKYALEFDVKCPEQDTKKKPKNAIGTGAKAELDEEPKEVSP